MSQLRRIATLVLCVMAAPLTASAQTVVSNEGDPAVTIHTFSGFQTITYGQIFVAPNASDTFLQSMRFSVGADPAIPYTVRLMEWTGTMAGTVLFFASFAATPTTRSYVEFAVNAQLAFGSQYIFALSAAPGGANLMNFMSLSSDTYAGGHEAYLDTDDLGTLQSANWTQRTDFDLGFTATFLPGQTVVPEPATVLLLGTGLAGLALMRRRRSA